MTTDASGNWTATVPPGTTTADILNPPAGTTQTEGTDPTTVTAVAGQNTSAGNDGYYQSASLGDYVWNDLNRDGIQNDGTTGISGVTVNLYKSDGTPAGTTTTDVNGYYSFTNLVPGDYYVQFIAPSGYTLSPQDQGGNDAIDSDADTTTGKTVSTTLTSGENDLTWDAGMYQLASLGDYVWQDSNVNGIQDSGEPGIANVTVKLYKSNSSFVASTTTDANGSYSFTNLMPGDYYVEFSKPSGYYFSPKDQGSDDAIDSDADITNGKTTVTILVSGENDTSWDAGLYQKAAIGDLVWNDINANGIQDSGEPGIANVTVKLYKSDGSFVASTTTNANGIYSFTDLMPGDYYVEFSKPSGYYFSPKDQGSDDAKDSDVDTTNGKTTITTLISGENDTTWDAGLYQAPKPFEGLTPGYWKNHPESWPPTGYVTTQQVKTVFIIPSAIDPNIAKKTLIDTLGGGGGSGINGAAKILLRAAVAALLNAAHPNINYPLTVGKVISDVNTALASLNRDTMLALATTLDNYNNLGGDISAAPGLLPKMQAPEPQIAPIVVPRETRLLANYPNPFNPETWIPFELAEAANVKIEIYDMTGRLVRMLDLGYRPEGYYVDRSAAAYWNGRNFSGERVANGVYFYQLTAGDFSAVRRMLILK
ncbi:T9SS type A sorting domain-containing protein [Candidatus Poribacteria bacterium]|nr:T9SS type A sorting domain-containing protein [Candidatus Poribacteria bacterium]